MLVRAEIAALRSDPAPQRQAQALLQAALAAWREETSAAALDGELEAFAGRAGLDALAMLGTLFSPGDPAAYNLTGSLVARLCAALTQAPLGLVPLRHFGDDTLASLMLARSGAATLSVQAISGCGAAAPLSLSFAPVETHEHVLAGLAQAAIVRCTPDGPRAARLERRPFALRPGVVSDRDGRVEAMVLEHVASPLVVLRLQRREAGSVTREYRLADGALIHQAAGSPRDSRTELAAALLGRMGRADAAPVLAEIAIENAAPHMRWSALRECLGLDAAAGFIALSRIAADPTDTLAAPAGALRAQLIEQHPELALCPA